jgi:bifunctional non-homologous end joining protein LigD
MSEQSISLYCTKGNSNKVYKLSLESDGDGYIVNYANGRIGNTLRTGTKTQKPVPLEKAQAIYNKTVKAKIAGGYRPDESQESDYIHERDSKDTGIRPQLLNPISDEHFTSGLLDSDFWLQEKHDGERMMAQYEGGVVVAINRKGLCVGASKSIVTSLKSLPEQTIVDGEAVGDNYYVFDVMAHQGKCVRHLPYSERYALLESFELGDNAHLVKNAKTTSDKKAMFNRCLERGAEGVVIKDKNAPYIEGRPASGGDQLKFKFYKTASVVVAAHNDKRSVQMSVKQGDVDVFVGNVTIPPNAEIPPLTQVIEVRYLYAYEGGSLYQPTYIGKRTDIDADECVISQLEYKQVAA